MGSILSTLSGPRPAGIPAGAATQITTTELPSEFKPFITDIFEKARTQQEGLEYTPYPGARLAPFGPLQEEAFTGLTGLARQGVAGAPDTSSAFYAQEALEAARRAGRPIEAADIERLTNPYQQQVIDIAKREAERAYERNVAPQIEQQAVAAGSFGGSRAGMLEAEGLRNLQQQLSDIQMKGSAQGYQEAQQAYEQEANRARGLQGFMQQQQQTVPTQALKELGVLQSVGEAQQLLDQKALNLGYEDFLEEREFPTRSLQEYQASVRGFPYTPAAYQYTQQTSPTPSLGATLLGAATTGLGIYGQLGGFTPGGGVQQGRASGGQIRGGLSGVVETHQNNTFGDRYRAGMGLGPGQKFGGERHGGRRFGGRRFGDRRFGGHKFGEQEIDPRSLINMLNDPELTEDEQQLIQEMLKDAGIRSTEDLWGNDAKMVQIPLVPGATIAANPNIEMVTIPAVSPTYRLRPPPSIPSITSPQIDQLNQRIKSLEQQGVLDAASILKKQRDELIDQIRNAAVPVLDAPPAPALVPEAGTGALVPTMEAVTPGSGLPQLLRRLRKQTGLKLPTEDEARARKIAQWKGYAIPRKRQAAITREALNRRSTHADELLRLAQDELGYARARMEEQKRNIERKREDLQKTSIRDREIFKTAQDEIEARGKQAIDIKREAGEAAQKLYAEEEEKLKDQRGRAIGSALLKSAKISEKTAAIPGWQGVLAGMIEIGQNWAEEAEGPLGELDDKERNLRRESFNDLWSNKEELNQLYIDIENNNLAGLERLTNFETKLRESEVNLNIAFNDTLDSLGEGKVAEARAKVNWLEAKAEVEQGHLALVKIEEDALIARDNAADKAAEDAADRILDAIKSINKGSDLSRKDLLVEFDKGLGNLRDTIIGPISDWGLEGSDLTEEDRSAIAQAYEDAQHQFHVLDWDLDDIYHDYGNTLRRLMDLPILPDSRNQILNDTAVFRKDFAKQDPESQRDLVESLRNLGYGTLANDLEREIK